MCADNEKLILDSLEFSVISEGECFSPKINLIGKAQIIFFSHNGSAKFYEFCVLKMKKGQSAHFAEQEPTPEQLRRLEEEMDEEIMDEYFDDYDTTKTIH